MSLIFSNSYYHIFVIFQSTTSLMSTLTRFPGQLNADLRKLSVNMVNNIMSSIMLSVRNVQSVYAVVSLAVRIVFSYAIGIYVLSVILMPVKHSQFCCHQIFRCLLYCYAYNISINALVSNICTTTICRCLFVSFSDVCHLLYCCACADVSCTIVFNM